MREDVEGLIMVDGELKFAIAGMVVDIQLTPDEKRRMAVALALSADRDEGIASPAEALFIAGELEIAGQA